MKLSIKGQGHSLTLVKGHSDFKVKCLTFGLYTQVSNSGPHGPLVLMRGHNLGIYREIWGIIHVTPFFSGALPKKRMVLTCLIYSRTSMAQTPFGP